MWRKEEVSIDFVVDYLNKLVEIDSDAIMKLILNRVPCNDELGNHPTVQCALEPDGIYVGLLGIINGMFGVNERGGGPIAYVINTDTKEISGFEKVWQ